MDNLNLTMFKQYDIRTRHNAIDDIQKNRLYNAVALYIRDSVKAKSVVIGRDARLYVPELAEGEEDPRLTRVGRFLRAHHLDELPQLWNVFKGDMSFIGYRPERAYYIDKIMERNPRYRFLYQMRPGITSYATLYNGYTSTLEKMLTRLDMDLYYLRTRSVWTDIRVLGLTFLRIVAGKRF